MLFFFFFSSRRRHTRLQGDWSSDVCSSDLGFPNDTARSIEVAPGSVVELDPRHATGERLGGLELRSDDHRAGRIDIPLLAVDRERSQSLGEPLCPIRLREPHHYFSPAVDVTPQHPRRLRGPLCDCRSAIGEAPDAVELRGNHDDAGRVDVAPLTALLHGSEALGERRGPLELGRNDEASRTIDVSPLLARWMADRDGVATLGEPAELVVDSAGNPVNLVELGLDHHASGRVDEAPLLAHLDSSQALRKFAWIARIARRDYHKAFGVDKNPFLSYLDAAATLTEKRG